jgi:hypothetical protein
MKKSWELQACGLNLATFSFLTGEFLFPPFALMQKLEPTAFASPAYRTGREKSRTA